MAQAAEFMFLFLRNLPDNRDVIGAQYAAQRPRMIVNLEFVLKGRSRRRDASHLRLSISSKRSRPYCHKAAPMAAEPNAPGHNKQYYEEEENLLIVLKQLEGLSWPEIAVRFNESVPADRHRTASALENKWRQLRKTHQ
ncbi:hypothetical protein PENFLA_c001G04860 [Penicillium flavigenum]|uniref:Myb-like domain-containing protein n=1 Tax=Penicillium flavigenum TaxID=254877 RepID=A0A1V6S7U7_9EURO|nr:hypothetical protein PENFLA_c091G07012 [Penicillium flavigenum]OQE33075.1 hypothetical protein PENFLA_c001G04860 [Penicillium flavigenum]